MINLINRRYKKIQVYQNYILISRFLFLRKIKLQKEDFVGYDYKERYYSMGIISNLRLLMKDRRVIEIHNIEYSNYNDLEMAMDKFGLFYVEMRPKRRRNKYLYSFIMKWLNLIIGAILLSFAILSKLIN